MAGKNSIQFLRGNNISSCSATLLEGQPCYDMATGYLRVGDGSTIASTSPIKASYANDAGGLINGATSVSLNSFSYTLTVNGVDNFEFQTNSLMNGCMNIRTPYTNIYSIQGVNIQGGSIYLNALSNISLFSASNNTAITLAGRVQQGGNVPIPGALANGYQSAAFGGLRYDASSGGGESRTRTSAEGEQSFAAGGGAHARGRYSVAMGKDTNAYQRSSFAMGAGTQAGMTQAQWNTRYGSGGNDPWGDSYTESYSDALAVGEMTLALGRGAVAVGFNTNAYGHHAVAEGYDTVASGESSHSEGRGTVASGDYSYAGGLSARATAQYARSSGYGSMAQNTGALTHGISCYSNGDWQVVFGQYNELVANAALVIGNGTATQRNNALVVYSNGITIGTGIYGNTGAYVAEPDLLEKYAIRRISSSVNINGEDLPSITNSIFHNIIDQYTLYSGSYALQRAVMGGGISEYFTYPILHASPEALVICGYNGIYKCDPSGSYSRVVRFS